VAILDGQVMPAQYTPDRINRPDVQALLQRVNVRPSPEFSQRFPSEMPCRLTVYLKDGRVLVKEKTAYEGFHTNPMRWETVVRKLDLLSEPYADSGLRRQLVDAAANLDGIDVSELTGLLAQVRQPEA
jgi:2-methylcitrate dehydratase